MTDGFTIKVHKSVQYFRTSSLLVCCVIVKGCMRSINWNIHTPDYLEVGVETRVCGVRVVRAVSCQPDLPLFSSKLPKLLRRYSLSPLTIRYGAVSFQEGVYK